MNQPEKEKSRVIKEDLEEKLTWKRREKNNHQDEERMRFESCEIPERVKSSDPSSAEESAILTTLPCVWGPPPSDPDR